LPVRPSHIRTDESHDADAAQRPSGENETCETCSEWPTSRPSGFVFVVGPTEATAVLPVGKGDHRKSV
jgi:hypothetical protein